MTKSKTSDDVETITINYDTNSVYDTDMSSGNFTISLDNLTTDDSIARQFDSSNWVYAQMPFVDSMPSLDRINSMCSEYPALAKAYEQFKFIYKMTEQDYKGKLKERGLDDDIPF